jgi:hypothetical protein
LYLRDLGPTEVGGFGISNPDDLLLVEDFVMVRQHCSPVTVAFEDDAVAEFFDQQTDAGRHPEQFARIWIHTHPGNCPQPSFTDEQTFARVFGRSDWAVMAILACGGESYARLSFHIGPYGSLTIPIEVDFEQPFVGTDWEGWQQEYAAHVSVEPDFGPDGFEEFRSRPETEYDDHNDAFHLARNQGDFDDRSILTTTITCPHASSRIIDGHGDRCWGDW